MRHDVFAGCERCRYMKYNGSQKEWRVFAAFHDLLYSSQWISAYSVWAAMTDSRSTLSTRRGRHSAPSSARPSRTASSTCNSKKIYSVKMYFSYNRRVSLTRG